MDKLELSLTHLKVIFSTSNSFRKYLISPVAIQKEDKKGDVHHSHIKNVLEHKGFKTARSQVLGKGNGGQGNPSEHEITLTCQQRSRKQGN